MKASPAVSDPVPPNVFRRAGEYWTLAYGGNVVHLKDSKGLGDIARLLARPGEGVHLADLVGVAGQPVPADADELERARIAVAMRVRNALKRIAAAHPDLGRHLSRSIETGTHCRYDPERPTCWEMGWDRVTK